MTNCWLIDTDILIDYFKNVPGAVSFLEKIIENSVCYISVITVAELYAGVREGKERELIEKFLEIFKLIFVDDTIAKKGGLYRREYGKSHGTGLADALIAASAEENNCKLVTLNQKHFPMLKNKFIPYSKSTK